MKVLLLGGGGREHALGWKLSQSDRLSQLISAPGNPGLGQLGETLPSVDPTDVAAVTRLAVERGVDLVVVGPEAPLAAGVVDSITAAGVPVWGPSQRAAALETSKAFAKQVMDEAGVPTACWQTFDQVDPALAYLRAQQPPYVIKANGLAAGKGVLVTTDQAKAEAWVSRCLGGGFGERRIVIEEFLRGPELSVFALCSGDEAVALEPARDFKRLMDGDKGPNTGGMGSYSPVTGLPGGIAAGVLADVIKPVLKTMMNDERPYNGFLYVGLVLTESGPVVLEFNCRLGDPETQVLMPRLASDLIDLIEASLGGRVAAPEWNDLACLNVVLAAPGYPEASIAGVRIRIGDLPDRSLVFHAGTGEDHNGIFARGGRVLNVVGTGSGLAEARANAYAAVKAIEFPGALFRRDI
ncbi:MAG: phosphoribosylamine--glycine ligase [Acidimicrobiia bacterium]|nr:phosphoribosylamine--glycine ligase [Acidimicrobiia bacterium]